VEPGFGGQQFIPSVLSKISIVRKFLDTINKPIHLAIDGGITLDNIGNIARLGVNVFVAGSAIFQSHDYSDVITKMRTMCCS
jgi:ribulose-phosphate 3-epimerase